MNTNGLTKQQLNGQLPPAFGSARFKNTTTVAGSHALHKTMFAFARYALGLPGTFHKNPDLLHL
jgi:hypothetical protein